VIAGVDARQGGLSQISVDPERVRVDDRQRHLARRRIIALPNKEIGNPSADRGAHFRARHVADYQVSLINE
jgi:hypothetical protein